MSRIARRSLLALALGLAVGAALFLVMHGEEEAEAGDPCVVDGVVRCIQAQAVVAIWPTGSPAPSPRLELSGAWPPQSAVIGEIIIEAEVAYSTVVASGTGPLWSGGFYPSSLEIPAGAIIRGRSGGFVKEYEFTGFPEIALCSPLAGTVSGTAPAGSTVHVLALTISDTPYEGALTNKSQRADLVAGKDGQWSTGVQTQNGSAYQLDGALVIASVVDAQLDAARVAVICEEPTPTPTATLTPSRTATPTEAPTATTTPTNTAVLVFEGWHEVSWMGAEVSDVVSVIAAVTTQTAPSTAWRAIAQHTGGGWKQTFADAPLPSFNTLDELLTGGDYWLFVSEDAEFG